MLELETAREVAQRVKLNPLTIRRMGYRGLIHEYKYGRAVRYNPEEVIRVMMQGPEEHTTPSD